MFGEIKCERRGKRVREKQWKQGGEVETVFSVCQVCVPEERCEVMISSHNMCLNVIMDVFSLCY